MNRISRRSLLSGLGALGLGLPMLESVAGRQVAFAQNAPPRRLLLMLTPNGTLINEWKPVGSPGTNFTMGPLLSPLETPTIKSKCVVIEGLNVDSANPANGPGDGHQPGIGTVWTGTPLLPGNYPGGGGALAGWGGGPSVDQVIADVLNPQTLQRSVQLGVGTDTQENHGRMIFRASNQPLSPVYDPRAAFQTLAGYLGGGGPQQLQQLRPRRRKVVDLLQAQAQELRPRLSTRDRATIDQHLSALSSLEQSLSAPITTPSSCTVPPPPTPPMGNTNPFWFNVDQNLPLVTSQQMQIATMALACDVTRFASIQFDHSQSDVLFSFLNVNGLTITENHHDLSHQPVSNVNAMNALRAINTWYAQRFVDLLNMLAAVPEGNGTLLDNTLVVWGNELQDGRNHDHNGVPFVVAGGAGVGLVGGRYLRAPAGTRQNALLVSICHALGATSVSSVGKAEFNSGPLAGLIS